MQDANAPIPMILEFRTAHKDKRFSPVSVDEKGNVVTRGKAAGAKVIIMNNQPTDRDQYADAFLMGDITEMLPALVAIPD